MSERNKNRCVVLLPFGPHFQRLFDEVLEPAILEAGLVPLHHRQNSRLPTPINVFVDEIEQASALFADISENIPEIWLAIGCAVSLGMPLCLISSRLESSLPLGVQYLPLIPYPADPFPSDYLQLRQHIIAQLSAIAPQTEIVRPIPQHSASFVTPAPIPAPPDELVSYEILALTILDLKATSSGLSPRELALEMQSRNSAHLASHAMNALKRRGFIEKGPVQISEGAERHIVENLFLTRLGEEWLIRHGVKATMHRSTTRIRAFTRTSK
jgi:hypothetical protein